MHSKKLDKSKDRSESHSLVDDEIDIDLLMHNLSLSYEERIENHDSALRLMKELQKAGRKLNHGKSK